jgi:hypothetical protein
MNYSTLVGPRETVGSIQYAINYSRIDSDGILDEAEAWIYAKLRVPDMRSTATVTIASGASTASFPTGYRDPIHFGIPGFTSRLKLKDIDWFRTHLGFDEDGVLPEGQPSYWCKNDGLIQLNTLADQEYSARMVYYRTPTALSASNETNWLTDKYPTLLRRVCLMFAAEARKEYDTFDREEARALKQIDEIRIEADDENRGIELDFEWSENT